MPIMGNKWIEKEASKHSILKTTAPSYERAVPIEFVPIDPKRPIKRHTKASRANMIITLRGVRK